MTNKTNREISERVASCFADYCGLSANDAKQEAALALMAAEIKEGEINPGLAAIVTRNHFCDLASAQRRQRRSGVHVATDVERIADADNKDIDKHILASRIADIASSLGSTESVLALVVVLQTLSRKSYKSWIEENPNDWRIWLDAADMPLDRAAQITPEQATRYLDRLMRKLRGTR